MGPETEEGRRVTWRVRRTGERFKREGQGGTVMRERAIGKVLPYIDDGPDKLSAANSKQDLVSDVYSENRKLEWAPKRGRAGESRWEFPKKHHIFF